MAQHAFVKASEWDLEDLFLHSISFYIFKKVPLLLIHLNYLHPIRNFLLLSRQLEQGFPCLQPLQQPST